MWPWARGPGRAEAWRAFPAQGHSLGAESQSLVAPGTFRAQWNHHYVWPYLIGLARVSLAHYGLSRSAAFVVMAGSTRPHTHFLLGSKPQTQKRTGERRGGVVGRLGAPQSDTSGFEPQHPHHTVVSTLSLRFLIGKWGVIWALHTGKARDYDVKGFWQTRHRTNEGC